MLSLLRSPLRTLKTSLTELLRLPWPEDGRELCRDELAEGNDFGHWLLGGAQAGGSPSARSSQRVTVNLGGLDEGVGSSGELALARMGFRTSVMSREMLRSTPWGLPGSMASSSSACISLAPL